MEYADKSLKIDSKNVYSINIRVISLIKLVDSILKRKKGERKMLFLSGLKFDG